MRLTKLSEADIERSRDRKGAFFELVQMETDAMIEEMLSSDWYQRAEYERWFNEPFEVGVLRQFRQVLAVIAWAAQWCPRSGGDHLRHEGAFEDLLCCEITAQIQEVYDQMAEELFRC